MDFYVSRYYGNSFNFKENKFEKRKVVDNFRRQILAAKFSLEVSTFLAVYCFCSVQCRHVFTLLLWKFSSCCNSKNLNYALLQNINIK